MENLPQNKFIYKLQESSLNKQALKDPLTTDLLGMNPSSGKADFKWP